MFTQVLKLVKVKRPHSTTVPLSTVCVLLGGILVLSLSLSCAVAAPLCSSRPAESKASETVHNFTPKPPVYDYQIPKPPHERKNGLRMSLRNGRLELGNDHIKDPRPDLPLNVVVDVD